MPRGEYCEHPACEAIRRCTTATPERLDICENCDTSFCEDHGTNGGDRYFAGFAPVAYPSVCWKCGGYDADEA